MLTISPLFMLAITAFAAGQDADQPCLIPVPMIYMPVCGSDGKVYGNSHQLRAQNICYNKNIRKVDSSNCPDFPEGFGSVRGRRSVCNVPVPAIYDPVCGSDGKVYDNRYVISAQNQCEGTNVREVDASRCPGFNGGIRVRRNADVPASGRRPRPCFVPIPYIYAPVCGSDGIVYPNEYLIRKRNICDGESIQVVDSAKCADFPSDFSRPAQSVLDAGSDD